MAKQYRRAKVIIDLKNIEHNFSVIKNSVNKGVKICPVVKADAYGHGAVKICKLCESLGANFFAVATFYEALSLRKSGIKTPILILGYTPPNLVNKLEFYNLSQTVYSVEYATALLKNLKGKNAKIKIHLKVDSGLNRLGFSTINKSESALLNAVKILKNERFILEVIFTHFACSDNYYLGKNYTLKQYSNFLFAVKFFEQNGMNFSIKHASNSGALFNFKKLNMDMVRVGISLYGIAPSTLVKKSLNLKKVMQFTTIIESVKLVKKGQNIGYGLECFAVKDTLVATIPVGYADGLLRSTYKSGYKVKVNGVYCPFIGKINMDNSTIDVTGANAKVFDEVLIFGSDENSNVENLSTLNSTIPYETLCGITKRVERIYK